MLRILLQLLDLPSKVVRPRVATCPGTLAPHQLCCARQTPGIELELSLARKLSAKFSRQPPTDMRRLSFVRPSPKMLVQVVDPFMCIGPPDPVGWTVKHRLINSHRMYPLKTSIVLRAANPPQRKISPRSIMVRLTWSTRLRFCCRVQDPRRSLRSPDPADRTCPVVHLFWNLLDACLPEDR